MCSWRRLFDAGDAGTAGGGICATWLKLTKVKDSIAKEIDKSLAE